MEKFPFQLFFVKKQYLYLSNHTLQRLNCTFLLKVHRKIHFQNIPWRRLLLNSKVWKSASNLPHFLSGMFHFHQILLLKFHPLEKPCGLHLPSFHFYTHLQSFQSHPHNQLDYPFLAGYPKPLYMEYIRNHHQYKLLLFPEFRQYFQYTHNRYPDMH